MSRCAPNLSKNAKMPATMPIVHPNNCKTYLVYRPAGSTDGALRCWPISSQHDYDIIQTRNQSCRGRDIYTTFTVAEIINSGYSTRYTSLNTTADIPCTTSIQNIQPYRTTARQTLLNLTQTTVIIVYLKQITQIQTYAAVEHQAHQCSEGTQDHYQWAF